VPAWAAQNIPDQLCIIKALHCNPALNGSRQHCIMPLLVMLQLLLLYQADVDPV
jgi:hypothetical protein